MRKPFSRDWPLTQGWGENPDIYKRFGLKGHNGQDYGLPSKTEVLAPHDGKVLERANDPTGYGNYLKIESAIEGSILAHLDSFKVNLGDEVKEGQVVALSDNTGFSTGPHLHWGYYRIPRNRNDGYLGYIDQISFIDNYQAKLAQSNADRDINWNYFTALCTELGIAVNATDKEGTKNGAIKKITELKNENIGLKKEIKETSDRNAVLADELKKMSISDATAIDVGLKAEAELGKKEEEIVKPVMQERNQLYQIIFEEGLGVYKRVQPQINSFWKYWQDKLLKVWFR